MVCVLYGCDTGTVDFGSLGNINGVVADADQIVIGTGRFEAKSRSIALGHVRASSHKCHFGQVTDPETGATLRAEYAVQLHCFEGNNFPERDSLTSVIESGTAGSNNAKVECDSVEVLVYYDSWYGDKSVPLKVNVMQLSLDADKILPVDSTFYTDVDLSNFTDGGPAIASKVFTIWDYTLSNSELTSSNHTHCARIRLPKSFGDKIMQQYYIAPESFKDSYAFTRKVCPGFYMQFAGGDGAMMAVSSTSLNVYYRYHYVARDAVADTVTIDTIYNAYTNFVGSAEVVQATNFSCANLDQALAKTECTYVTSPAGIGTEIELPIDDIFLGHEADSLARVQLTIMRYNSGANDTQKGVTAFAPPATLGMILKSEQTSFFEKGYELTSRKFATASFSTSYNTYDFSNIARLVKYMHEQRDSGDPDWNKVVLMPVTVTTNSASNTVINVLHDMNVTSARLVGGDTPLKIDVTYSRYK